MLTKAVSQARYRANVGNLPNTSHSTEPTPPATLAEYQTFMVITLANRS